VNLFGGGVAQLVKRWASNYQKVAKPRV